jgi:hypothetical protein
MMIFFLRKTMTVARLSTGFNYYGEETDHSADNK